MSKALFSFIVSICPDKGIPASANTNKQQRAVRLVQPFAVFVPSVASTPFCGQMLAKSKRSLYRVITIKRDVTSITQRRANS